MNSALEALITLHDLDVMIQELETPHYQELGFEVKDHLLELEKARREVLKKVPEGIFKKYSRLREKRKRGIAPVIGGVCLNCFIHLPIAFISTPEKNEELQTCPNCGIYIYWA